VNRCRSHSDTRKYRSMSVLVSRHEAIFEGSEIESALSRRRRYTQGGGCKDLLGVDANHKLISHGRGRSVAREPRESCAMVQVWRLWPARKVGDAPDSISAQCQKMCATQS
jgi:hypothetical protein